MGHHAVEHYLLWFGCVVDWLFIRYYSIIHILGSNMYIYILQVYTLRVYGNALVLEDEEQGGHLVVLL